MNREIKFRAWDKKDKKMLLVNEENAKLWRAYPIFPDVGMSMSDGIQWSKERAKDFELMQFSGLLDKNGKEIYEGDVVEYYSCSNGKGEVWLSFHGGVCRFQGEYGFKNGYFQVINSKCVSDEIKCTGSEVISKYGGVEVIGNIYEI